MKKNNVEIRRVNAEILFGSGNTYLLTITKLAAVSKIASLFQLFVLLSIRMVVQNSSLPEFSAQDNPAAFHKSLLTR